MSMLKPVILALSMLLVAPVMVHAAEITLLPAVKLQIGDRDRHGNYWDGGHWRDHDWWGRHYEWHDNRWRAHYNNRHDYHHNDHHDHHNDHHDDHHGWHH